MLNRFEELSLSCIIKYLPDITKLDNFPEEITDENVATYFELDDEERKYIYDLPKEQFFNKLKTLNGTPQDLLNNEDLMSLMEPIIRNDFKVIETLKYVEGESLNIPISVFSGMDDDHFSMQAMQTWEVQTSQAFDMQVFQGDHFYLHEQEKSLLDRINKMLSPRRNIF